MSSSYSTFSEFVDTLYVTGQRDAWEKLQKTANKRANNMSAQSFDGKLFLLGTLKCRVLAVVSGD